MSVVPSCWASWSYPSATVGSAPVTSRSAVGPGDATVWYCILEHHIAREVWLRERGSAGTTPLCELHMASVRECAMCAIRFWEYKRMFDVRTLLLRERVAETDGPLATCAGSARCT